MKVLKKIACLLVSMPLLVYSVVDSNHLNKSLKKAIADKKIDAIEQCLKQGADINIQYYDKPWERGFAPLHYAVETQDYATVLKLLEDPTINVNICSESGFTPLIYLMNSGTKDINININIVQALLEKGANPNKATEYGQSALSSVIDREVPYLNRNELVEILIKYNVDINAPGVSGFTALHSAAQQGDRDLVTFLLKRGADSTALTKSGMSPAQCAFSLGYSELSEELCAFAQIVTALQLEPSTIQSGCIDKAIALNKKALSLADNDLNTLYNMLIAIFTKTNRYDKIVNFKYTLKCFNKLLNNSINKKLIDLDIVTQY